MLPVFENLKPEESDLMLKAPVLVTILVAAADNDIDKKEREWAIKLTKFRSFSSKPVLQDYYTEVNKNFENTLDRMIAILPSDHLQRNRAISAELEKLNHVFPKLDKHFSESFYESLLGFAKQVAESSGGILRFSTISDAEKQWIGLSMIRPPQNYS